MWDAVQDMHPKTLSCCFVLEPSARVNTLVILRDMLDEVMKCGARDTPLHLKILAMHEDTMAAGEEYTL